MQTISGVRSSGGYNYPPIPRQQVIDLLRLLKSSSEILDIGAGFGNNCEPLLKAGHRVTATETNNEALEALDSLSKQFPGQLTIIEEPLELLKDNKSYDAIVCTMVLHFLEVAAAQKAINMIQKITNPGGYNVIINYLSGQNLSKEYVYLLKSGELQNLYKQWEVTFYEESYPIKLRTIRSAKRLIGYLLGRKGFKSAKLIAKKNN
jgi:tellurite methyltransferase